MDIIQKKISFDTDELLSLLSYDAQLMNLIENRFRTAIIIRGREITLKGYEDEIKAIKAVLKELDYLLTRNGKLTEKDIISVLDLIVLNGGSDGRKAKKIDAVIYRGAKEIIIAKNKKQKLYNEKVLQNDLVFAIGPAGTGKTYLAVAMALAALKKNEVGRIILSRPAVEAGESLGFLPGDLHEKIDPYLRPLLDALNFMVSPDKLKNMKERQIIEITPLAYMRGRTLNNSFIILDEAQNATNMQMKMFLTRLGVRSKAIVTGDITQIDLPDDSMSGLISAKNILQGIDGIEFVYFDRKDVVRHRLVAEIIEAYEKQSKGKK